MSQPFDTDGDGYADAYVSDTNGDGYIDQVDFDTNQDGILDGVAADLDGDGVFETAGYDGNQDGLYEEIAIDGQVLVDTDYDGAADTVIHSEPQGYVPGDVVGGAPSYDGAGGLVVDLAGASGSATWGTPDSDADGYSDAVDMAPYDPGYY